MNSFETLNIGDVKPKILTGGKTGKFLPNVNMSFHDDEFFININRKDKIITTETASQVGDKVKLNGKDTDVFHIDADGRFKWDIEFVTKPDSNVFKWEMKHSKELNFFYQRELTQSEIDEGLKITDGLVGSYSVYCSKRNNKYKIGKLCDIHKPICIDSSGRKIDADLVIDKGNIIITIPQEYIDTAVYPMTLDPTIGFSGTPNTYANTSNVSYVTTGSSSGSMTASSDGTCNTMYVYVRTSFTGSINVGIYDNNGSPNYNLLSSASLNQTWSTGWQPVTVTEISIVSGNTYHVASGHPTTMDFSYDTTSGNACYRNASATLLNPWNYSAAPRAYAPAVYLDYTETSTGGGVLVGDSALVGGSLLCGQGVLVG